ncbi:hypothetical protein Hypma_010623 [Hypsizygus marmoreus]|uniref:Uncharacterized protein n=1 Tax=Hypsizygus marmoreus TaxID=39966 RepID=A0A369JRG8_HYPMA|nr:hypothetical protein Hypma_010623 [Hypsizygus marmoreus]
MSLALEDPSIWTWSPEAKARWNEASDEWQSFHSHFRNASPTETESFPYRLSLLSSKAHRPRFLPFSGDRLLVRESYDELFSRACRLREEGPDFGIVVTGQPGNGKTTWLYYFLTQLLRMHQVVIFASRGVVFVFYHDGVYSLLETSVDADTFPECSKPIWCLIDPDHGPVKEPVAALTSTKVFPVMATSPNPNCYRAWKKQRRARMWGMPLWSEEELWEGLQLQSEYQNLFDEERTTPRDDGAMAHDDDETLNIAMEEKLKAAIYTYGTSPGDVYGALFDSDEIRMDLYDALDALRYEDILCANPFYGQTPSAAAHRIMCIKPRTASTGSRIVGSDSFDIDFKSEEIMRLVKDRLQLLPYSQARRLISFCQYHSSPEGSNLADCAFEAFTYALLTANFDTGIRIDLPDLISMVPSTESTAGNFSGFSTPDNSSSCTPSNLRFPVQTKRVVHVDFKSFILREPHSTLYVSKGCNNSLFDAFAFDFEGSETTGIAVVWIVRSTISTECGGGSDKGSAHIRAIKEAALKHVEKLLETDKGRKRKRPVAAQVVFKYVLACPSLPGKVKRTWTIPTLWDHQGGKLEGHVYCQHIPVEHAFGGE